MLQRLLKPSLILVAVVCLAAGAKAQYKWDIGVHVGASNYLGEMGGKEQTRRDFVWDMKLNQTRWAFGVFGRYKLNRSFSLNAGLMYLRIQGADALSTNPQRVGRNLNFRNDMFELYLRPEFTVFQDNDIGGRGRYRTDFRLFVYAGAALYYSNPKGQINRTGDFYALRPLTTELNNYSPLGFAIPAGIGMHITKKRRHRFGFDFGYRTTFSDYIDDVSTDYQNPDLMPGGIGGLADQLADQHSWVEDGDGPIPSEHQYGWETKDSDGKLNKRGDPTHNDGYLTVTLTYSYVLKGQSNFYRQRYSWIRGKKRIGRKSRAKF